jgi:hypothetical protein
MRQPPLCLIVAAVSSLIAGLGRETSPLPRAPLSSAGNGVADYGRNKYNIDNLAWLLYPLRC